MHLRITEPQQRLNRFHMLVVLVQRILKFLGVLIDLLRPIPLFRTSEDPPFHVLGFHHEHAVGRHDDVIDLRSTVFSRQGDVADQVVGVLVEKQARREINEAFADPAFELGRLDDTAKDSQRDEIPEGVD